MNDIKKILAPLQEKGLLKLAKYLSLGLVQDKPTNETIEIKVLPPEEAEKVRTNTDIDFTAGGHHYVYPKYIPEKEIWVEEELDFIDLLSTEVHEFVERIAMKYLKLKYDDAHAYVANPVEQVFRNAISKKRAWEHKEEKEKT